MIFTFQKHCRLFCLLFLTEISGKNLNLRRKGTTRFLLLTIVINIWVFHDTRFCQIIWQICNLTDLYTGESKKKKKKIQNRPQWGWNPGPPHLYSNTLPTELSQHSVASLNLHGLYKVMLYWFQKWTKSNMWSGASNKAHFRSLQPNRFLLSSVGRVMIRRLWVPTSLGTIFDNFFFFHAWRSVR